MPELPEVESVRRGLNELVVGETVEKVEVRWPRIIGSPSHNQFSRQLIGQTIEK
ncbi:MAG TPA: DNA-formamidopyrimidine glycosylase family protein, partial [Atopostipes sp.]|nr:DNA-formamidopyrimidine glycosylase family protein [Atopostipes sp.]